MKALVWLTCHVRGAVSGEPRAVVSIYQCVAPGDPAGGPAAGDGVQSDKDSYAGRVSIPAVVDYAPTRYRHAFLLVDAELRVAPGTIVRVSTLDAHGRDGSGRQCAERSNPLCGPIHVEGAMPGDAVVVEIRQLQVQGRSGFTAPRIAPHLLTHPGEAPGEAGVVDWVLTHEGGSVRMHPASGELVHLLVPVEPMLGCLGVAAASESAKHSIRAGVHGGNLDYQGVQAGSILMLPVSYEGGLVFLGDGHARQGDGETVGTGIEVPLDVEIRLDVLKGARLGAPRGVTPKDVFTIGTGRPLDAALRGALDELVAWLRSDTPLGEEAIAVLVGQMLAIDVANVFNPDYAVACRLPRAFLPDGFGTIGA